MRSWWYSAPSSAAYSNAKPVTQASGPTRSRSARSSCAHLRERRHAVEVDALRHLRAHDQVLVAVGETGRDVPARAGEQGRARVARGADLGGVADRHDHAVLDRERGGERALGVERADAGVDDGELGGHGSSRGSAWRHRNGRPRFGNGPVKTIDGAGRRPPTFGPPTRRETSLTDLHYLSATEVLRAFRGRELSPSRPSTPSSARADAVEPTVNCLLERDHEGVREAAEAATERYARGEATGALEGLPVALKEEQPIAGRLMRFGSCSPRATSRPTPTRSPSASTPPARSCTPARRRPSSPARPTPTRSCGASRATRGTPTTRRAARPAAPARRWPRARRTSPAARTSAARSASPRRSAASSASRRPTAACRRSPPFNLDTYCHDGAMGRTVADVALFHNVIQGQHPFDHVSLPALPIPADLGDVRGLRVALAVTLGDFPVEPEVEANTRRFAEALRTAGGRSSTRSRSTSPATRSSRGARALRRDHGSGAWRRSPTRRPALRALHPAVPDALERRASPRPAPTPASRASRRSTAPSPRCSSTTTRSSARPSAASASGPARSTPTASTSPASTSTSTCSPRSPRCSTSRAATPCSTCRRASRPNGVPTGVQVVARPYDDVTAFHVGAAAERELGIWNDPTWRPSL